MQFVCEMAIVLEIAFMNLCIFRKNVKNRYSLPFTCAILFLFTATLMLIGVPIIKSLGVYGNGNGIFTLFGFCYLLPLHYLFEENIRKHFYILCFAWIYTLSIFAISIQIASYFIDTLSLVYGTLLIQTILTLVSYYFVNKFMNLIYIALMQCRDANIQKNLNITSLLWFVSILIINIHFIFEDSRLLKILTIFVLILNAFYSFVLLFEILMKREKIGSLESTVAKDTLTGLGSRIAFEKTLETKIQSGKPFNFIYLDLDKFKSINDEYGHLIGDQYLREFSSCLQDIGKPNTCFRISGDEFVLLVSDKALPSTMEKVKKISFLLSRSEASFHGVSYGIARYPEDGKEGEELISIADKQMYEAKLAKKKS